jgi:hypothetical protein
MAGTGTGRYCLATCYCGGCSHYRPIPSVDWSQIPGSRDHARRFGPQKPKGRGR